MLASSPSKPTRSVQPYQLGRTFASSVAMANNNKPINRMKMLAVKTPPIKGMWNPSAATVLTAATDAPRTTSIKLIFSNLSSFPQLPISQVCSPTCPPTRAK